MKYLSRSQECYLAESASDTLNLTENKGQEEIGQFSFCVLTLALFD